MGVLDRFEKGVERALSSTFARAFRADLKPVDIASALRNEMDDRAASLSRGRTVVPNVFVVEFAEADRRRIDEWGADELANELVTTATSHAADQGYVFVGPVHVTLEEFSDFSTGQFKIRSSSAHLRDPIFAEPEPPAPDVANTPEPVVEEPAVEGFVPTPAPQPGAFRSQPIIDVDGQRYLLTGERTVLGRGSEADIILSDTGVSREHLEIRVTPGGVIARDLGSTNGTFVEGHRVDAATLVDGNTITIGRTRITFWAGAGAPSSGGAA